MLLSDIRLDFVRSEIAAADARALGRGIALFAEMEGDAALARARARGGRRARRLVIDARYHGQNFEVHVAIRGPSDGRAQLRRSFEERRTGGNTATTSDRTVEIVNCRLQAVGTCPRRRSRRWQRRTLGRPAAARAGARSIAAPPAGSTRRSIARAACPGRAIAGPGVIEEMSRPRACVGRPDGRTPMSRWHRQPVMLRRSRVTRHEPGSAAPTRSPWRCSATACCRSPRTWATR